jgi:hypothetical protein
MKKMGTAVGKWRNGKPRQDAPLRTPIMRARLSREPSVRLIEYHHPIAAASQQRRSGWNATSVVDGMAASRLQTVGPASVRDLI